MTTYNILCACQMQNRVTIVGLCIPNRVQETSLTIHIFVECLFLVCIKHCSSHRQTVFPIPFGRKRSKQTRRRGCSGEVWAGGGLWARRHRKALQQSRVFSSPSSKGDGGHAVPSAVDRTDRRTDHSGGFLSRTVARARPVKDVSGFRVATAKGSLSLVIVDC
jgi:hypothetical protein